MATKAKRTAKAAPKAERKTVASEAKRLILAGRSNEEIVKALRLPNAKRHYPGWYRAQLVRIERKAKGAKAAEKLAVRLAATR